MNPLDWMVAVLLAYSMVRATLRGFFREAFALAGVVAGFLLACWEYEAVGRQLREVIKSGPLSQLAGFLLILTASMVAAAVIGSVLRKTASTIGLGLVDRLLGAAFGLVRGALFVGALLLAIKAFLPSAAWMKTSVCAPYFLGAAHDVSFVMPTELRRRFLDGPEPLKQAAPAWIHSYDPVMPWTTSRH